MSRGRPSFLTILAICVVGLSLACAPEVTTKPTAPAASPGPAVAPRLGEVKVDLAERHTRVVLTGNQPLTYTAFKLKEPPLVIVDVGATAGPEVLGPIEIKNKTIDRVEVETVQGMENMHRVKIHLAGPTPYEVVREDNNLVVLVTNLPGTTAARAAAVREEAGVPAGVPETGPARPVPQGETAVVTGVHFRPLDETGRTRLSVQTDFVVEPQVMTRDSGRTVILSLTPTRISRHLSRPLDTSFFRSAVNYIKPTQARGPSVDFVIRLREVVPYHLGQEGLMTYLDFDPSAVPPQKVTVPEPRPEAAAPAKPAEVIAAAPGEEPKRYTGQRISLDFQNADIHNILRLIGEVSGKNVVVSDKVTGTVTLKLKDVPWDQALDIVLKSQQLGMEIVGNVIRVEKMDILRAERQEALKQKELQREQLKKVPLEKRVFTPKYAAVDLMKTQLEKLKSERGKLTVIGNDIYVEDEPEVLSQMAEVFQKNDEVVSQILIESRIVEALTSFSKNLGLNWGGHYNINDNPGVVDGTLGLFGAHGGGTAGAGGAAVNLITPPATGLALGFNIATTAFNLDAHLYAMEQTGEGRIVSAPRILANNDQEVYIKQGQAIPFESSGTTTTPATVSFQEAVLELKVKPHIEENGEIISMDIKVTKDTPDWARGVRNPPINKREASTKLMVKNGETVVIGGIIVDEKAKSINRVPGLHRIPVIGWLFKNYEVTDTKLELLIFLTSHIIPVKI